MDKKIIKVGLIICDRDEYVQVNRLASESTETFEEFGFFGHNFIFEKSKHIIKLCTVCSGIGKVNAASCAMYLISKGIDIMLNTGYSGGLQECTPNQLIIGNNFLEHDFDLTVLGYPVSQKPNEDSLSYSDKDMTDSLKTTYPYAKCGTFVTGDCFISSDQKRTQLIKQFNALAADMESGAIAAVCRKSNIPFASLRIVSDGGDDNSVASYLSTLGDGYKENLLANLIFDWIRESEDEIWSKRYENK